LIGPDEADYSVEYNRKFVLTPLDDILRQARMLFGLGIEASAPGLLKPFLRRALDAIMKPTDPRYEKLLKEIDEADMTAAGPRRRTEGPPAGDQTGQES